MIAERESYLARVGHRVPVAVAQQDSQKTPEAVLLERVGERVESRLAAQAARASQLLRRVAADPEQRARTPPQRVGRPVPEEERCLVAQRPSTRGQRQRVASADARFLCRQPAKIAALAQRLQVRREVLLVPAEHLVRSLAIEHHLDSVLLRQPNTHHCATWLELPTGSSLCRHELGTRRGTARRSAPRDVCRRPSRPHVASEPRVLGSRAGNPPVSVSVRRLNAAEATHEAGDRRRIQPAGEA